MSFFDIHINNSVVKIDNHFEGTFKQRNDEKTENQDCEDVDSEPVHDTSSNQHTEPVKETATPQEPLSNVPPTTVKDFSNSPLKPFFADQRIADIVLEWMHDLIDNADTPKGLMIPFRAVSEFGCFISRIPYDIYVDEFQEVAKSSFYYWMRRSFEKDPTEIDALITQLAKIIPKFPK